MGKKTEIIAHGNLVLGLKYDERCPYTLGKDWNGKCPVDESECEIPYLDTVPFGNYCSQKQMPLWLIKELCKKGPLGRPVLEA
jgi:hypothetical protein